MLDTRLILASASPRRRALLDQLGVCYTCDPAHINEVQRVAEDAPAYVQRMAQEKALAVAAHLALDARDFSRTDIMLDGDDRPWILETNTIPGLTAQSLLPQAAAVAGMTFPALVRRMLALAAKRR